MKTLAHNLSERLNNFSFGLRGVRLFEVDAAMCEEAAAELLRLEQLASDWRTNFEGEQATTCELQHQIIALERALAVRNEALERYENGEMMP